VAADVRGYYSALGLNAGAPIEAVRSAYRRLAKECHPDRASCVDGGQRFRRIAEAHDALSNPSFKAAYDSGSTQEQPKERAPPPKVEPIKCEVCGAVTAQPRRLAFWRVTSFILASQKTPIQKIYCQTCARKEQWISTIWTALLGWWGLPWGPVWASSHGITNAVGGARNQAVDDALLWQNAVAFGARGDGALAVGLGNILRKSANAEIAQHAADIIRFFSERGIDGSTTIKDVWKRPVTTTAMLLFITFAVPVALLALIIVPSTSGSNVSEAPSIAAANDSLPATSEPTATGSSAVPAAPPIRAAEQTCASPPSNGQILVDHRGRSADGHHLKIENGTAGDAIIKMRAEGGRTLASFFVARGQTATLTRIPDGSYTVQYASGDKLAKNCRTFVKDGSESANAFPGPDPLETRYEESLDGTSVVHSELTYTLYPVLGGTVQPNSINMDDFDRP
jgi:hypothetical protein